ncbi:MAG: Rpn family recombination-promoting nuclease/putative transposase [Firmicutes bacterium]|nr:Rpn family recombination-promoting nuclease/putative transposase [Bacillota bacterium]
MNVTEETKSKYIAKDSVFRNLFGIKKYAAQLYMALHPDETVTEDDIEHVTLESVIMATLYNDVGFKVKDKIIMLVEQQSTWTENIVVRMLVYLAETYYDYFEDTEQSLYGSTKVNFPKPELYLIYSGEDKKNVPEELSLSKLFMGGDNSVIDVNVKVITDGKNGDIIQQYVRFTKVYNEQVRLYGRNAKAVSETIRICENEDVLSDYLKSREREVSGIMLAFSDIDRQFDLYVNSKVKEASEKTKFDMIVDFVKRKIFSVPQAAEELNMTIEEFEEKSGLKDE